METNKQWFSHDYNTRNKKKIAYLMHEEGIKGYGMFWAIVEMLHEDSENWLELNTMSYIVIAQQTKTDVNYVEKFIERCIKEFKVFIEKKGRFTTERTLRNMKARADFLEKKSKAGKASARNRSSKGSRDENDPNTCSTPVEQTATPDEQNPTHNIHNIHNNTVHNNTDRTEEDSATKVADALRLEYEALVKDKKSVSKFVKEKSPKFHEPYKDLWNMFAKEKFGNKKGVIAFSDKRKKMLSARLKETAFDFCMILGKASRSNFLLKSNFFSFTWIIENGENYLKILEGNYDNDEPANEEKPMVR